MSNCSLSVKKFKDFNYVDGNLLETTSNISNNYNHNNLIPNDILLVGYRFRDVNDCPEIKIPLKFITTSNQQAIYFQVDNNNELQYTYDDPNDASQSWVSTGVTIPNGCNCDQNETSSLHLYFDESSGNLYYSQNEIDPSDLTNVEYVHINVNSSSGGDPVVGISNITHQHHDDNGGYTTVTITLTDNTTPSFNIPDGEDGAIPAFRIDNGNIQYSYNNTNWITIGPATIQEGGTTFAFNIRHDAASCTNIGDAYIDWDDSHTNTYGHLFYVDNISNNVLHFNDLGRIVGENGVSPTISVTPDSNGNGYTLTVGNSSYSIHNGASVGQLVYVSSDDIDEHNQGYNGNISATLSQSTNGGDVNCYDLQDSGGNSLGYIYIANGADGIDGKGVDSLDCTTNSSTPNNTPNNFNATSGAINQYTLYDTDGNTLGNIFVKNGINGTNSSGSGQIELEGGSVYVANDAVGGVEIAPISNSDGYVIDVAIPNNLIIPPQLQGVTVSTPSSGTASGSFSPVTGTPGAYDLSLTIPVADGQDGTTMELYRLVASGISATQVSNENYYRINSSSPTWSKYNPTNGTFEQLIQNPDFTDADFVEVCPADTDISDVINNLTYGTCGMYNNNTLGFYAVKDPTQAGTLCFTIKAYYNIQ